MPPLQEKMLSIAFSVKISDLGPGTGISELITDVFSDPHPVIMVKDALDIYPLADRRTFLQRKAVLPEFCLAGKGDRSIQLKH